jgi:endoglucanase
MVDLYKVLDYFMSAPAVTGFEEQRRSHIVETFKPYCDTIDVDVMGNIIGTIGEGERNVLLAGHYDQLGFMIKHVDKDGFATFSQVGGWDKRVAYGTRIKVWTGDGADDYIIGTIAVKPAHLTDSKEREKTPDLKDMMIDLGATSKDEAEEWGVKPGTVCTPANGLTRLGKGGELVIAPAFDDVCCVAAFIETMEQLKENPLKDLQVHFVATVQEEVGLRGATIAAYNLNPWVAIATDVTHAVAPDIKPGEVGGIELGKGPVISVGANFTRALWEIMEEQAKKNSISCQRQGVPARSGTDAWAMQIERGGTISGLISMPNRYMHSPNEVIHLKDLENLGLLLAHTLHGLEESDLKHSKQVHKK